MCSTPKETEERRANFRFIPFTLAFGHLLGGYCSSLLPIGIYFFIGSALRKGSIFLFRICCCFFRFFFSRMEPLVFCSGRLVATSSWECTVGVAVAAASCVTVERGHSIGMSSRGRYLCAEHTTLFFMRFSEQKRPTNAFFGTKRYVLMLVVCTCFVYFCVVK